MINLKHWSLDSDSYKWSHPEQILTNTSSMYSNIASRGGQFEKVICFGYQHILKALTDPLTVAQHEFNGDLVEDHGEPYYWDGWKTIAELGYIPVRIRAVPEGTWVPANNTPMFSVESTLPGQPWIESFIETKLVRLWYPTTTCTLSAYCRLIIQYYLDKTCDNPKDEILFRLHDFGARGVSSQESAGIGGAAHLVNFRGTDTFPAITHCMEYYNCKMAGYSIPAAEHSTITSWGKDHEVDAYRNMIKLYGKPGKIFAVVSDSYDIYNAITNIWGGVLKDEVIACGGRLVIRPDSGIPKEVVPKCLDLIGEKFGYTINNKGYKVLPNCVRLIQGDGINIESIPEILDEVIARGWSAENVTFGMGGGLLQSTNRDTCSFAQKCTSVTVNGKEIDVFKDPITDPGKRSKKGRLDLIRNDNGELETVRLEPGQIENPKTIMRTVFENGKILVEDTLDQIRIRAWG